MTAQTRPAEEAERAERPPEGGRARRALRAVASANAVTLTVLAVVLALVLGAILIVLGNDRVLAEYGYFFAQPGTALGDSWQIVTDAYGNLFRGAVFDPSALSGAIAGTNSWNLVFYPISETLTYTAPLIFTGLSVALAFRSGLFNIGGHGQVIFGCIGGALVGFALPLPPVLHLIAALLGAAVGGGLIGMIAGVLKARTGAHEVIVTIMLNNIAFWFLQWIITKPGVHNPARSDAISKDVLGSARLPGLGSGLRADLGVVLGVLAAAAVAWLLNRSTEGFELRAVGLNPDAARTAGMSVGRAYILAMTTAGALAGLGGGVIVLGPAVHLTGAVAGTVGFDGITVALLGRGKPWGVVASALLFGALHAGGNRMQQSSHVAIDLVTVVQAVIVIFIAAPALVTAIFRLRATRGVSASLAKGW